MPRRGPSQLWNPTAFSHIAVHCYSLLSHCCPFLQLSLISLSVATAFSHSPLLQPSLTIHCYSLLSQSIATAFSHIGVRSYSFLSYRCPLLQPSLTVHCYSLLSHCCPCYSLLSHCCSLLQPSLTLLFVATAFSHIAVRCYSLLSQSIATAFSHIAVSLPQLVTRLLIPALFFLSCTDEHRTVTCHFRGAVADTLDVRDAKKDGRPKIGGQRGQHRLLPSLRCGASTSSNVDQHQRSGVKSRHSSGRSVCVCVWGGGVLSCAQHTGKVQTSTAKTQEVPPPSPPPPPDTHSHPHSTHTPTRTHTNAPTPTPTPTPLSLSLSLSLTHTHTRHTNTHTHT